MFFIVLGFIYLYLASGRHIIWFPNCLHQLSISFYTTGFGYDNVLGDIREIKLWKHYKDWFCVLWIWFLNLMIYGENLMLDASDSLHNLVLHSICSMKCMRKICFWIFLFKVWSEKILVLWVLLNSFLTWSIRNLSICNLGSKSALEIDLFYT